MKYFESKIFIVLTCFALVLVLFNFSACTEADHSQVAETEADEAKAEIPVQTVANEVKEYPPVFNGPKIKAGDPKLVAETTAKEIMQNIFSDPSVRIRPKALVNSDTVVLQLAEDWDHEGKVWQFDYAQTGGDFSDIVFPQIGQDDEVFEVHREYSLRAGEVFFVSEVVFANRPDQSQVLHYNKYLFTDGKLTTWYRDQERYEVHERFYSQAQNLFPKINHWDFDTWVNSVFKDPQTIVEDYINLYGAGPNLEESLKNWIDHAKAMDPIVVSGEILTGDEYSQPVVWLRFGPGRNEMGAAFVLDWGEDHGEISVYDGTHLGIAYARSELCQSVGDVAVTLAWARKEKRKYEVSNLLDPKAGLVYGGIEDLQESTQTDVKKVMPEDLKLENVANPLYFNSLEISSDFDENGFATWSWTLPGSTETMIIQKTDSRLYWRAFQGAYH